MNTDHTQYQRARLERFCQHWQKVLNPQYQRARLERKREDQNDPRDSQYQRARLESMAKSFGLDVSEAQHLSGPELDAWLNAAEDRLFAQGLEDLAEMRAERERGYRPKPAPAP